MPIMRKHEQENRVTNYFKDRYQQFSSRTSMHGFGELYISKSSTGKLFWISALLACLSITTFQLTKATIQYVNEPYVSVIEKMKEEEILYPDIKICYTHWIYWVDFEKALKLNFTKESVMYGLSFLGNIYVENYFDIETAKRNFSLTMAGHNLTTLTEFYLAIAKPPPNDALSEKIFSDILCYKANPINIIKIEREFWMNDKRKKSKLEVVLKINDKKVDRFLSRKQHDCYMAQMLSAVGTTYPTREEFFTSNTSSDNDHEPLLLVPTYLDIDEDIVEIRWDDISVTINTHASVSRWQNKNTSPCEKSSVSALSNKTCQSVCREKHWANLCPCEFYPDIHLSRLDFPDRVCKYDIHFLTELESCIKLALNEESVPRKIDNSTWTNNCTLDKELCCYATEADKRNLDDCLKHCIPGCTMWNHYLGSTQRVKLGYFKEAYNKTFFRLKLIFPNAEDILFTNEIENQSLEKFIGNIGGLMGIWTGASVLSLVQLIYLCCCVEFKWFDKKAIKRHDTVLSDIDDNEESKLENE